jgi:hypothetical protein
MAPKSKSIALATPKPKKLAKAKSLGGEAKEAIPKSKKSEKTKKAAVPRVVDKIAVASDDKSISKPKRKKHRNPQKLLATSVMHGIMEEAQKISDVGADFKLTITKNARSQINALVMHVLINMIKNAVLIQEGSKTIVLQPREAYRAVLMSIPHVDTAVNTNIVPHLNKWLQNTFEDNNLQTDFFPKVKARANKE